MDMEVVLAEMDMVSAQNQVDDYADLMKYARSETEYMDLSLKKAWAEAEADQASRRYSWLRAILDA